MIFLMWCCFGAQSLQQSSSLVFGDDPKFDLRPMTRRDGEEVTFRRFDVFPEEDS